MLRYAFSWSFIDIFYFVPVGEYVLMVSLYSRLGGHVMKWSNLRGQKWGAATSPLMHDGEYYNTELKVRSFYANNFHTKKFDEWRKWKN